ncbi:unnamed protein product, partial [marine sediment metagenome]
IASIFTTIAFLEANINEILRDSYDTMKGRLKDGSKYIPEQLINKLSQFYKLPRRERHGTPLLKKYQKALTLAEKEIFDEEKNLYQNVDSLRQLRNNLVHYEPEWSKVQLAEDYIPLSDLAIELYSKFELNPLTPASSPFFPHRCLSYGCCKWGIESSIAFTDEFCKRTEIKSKYNNIRSKLVLD